MTPKRVLLLCLYLAAALLPPAGTAEEELLDPDDAFRIDVSAVDADTARVVWEVADGYYMYRSKIGFQTETEGVTLGGPELPPGKVKHDEFFGDVEIYRGRVSVDVPVQRGENAPDTIELTALSQGCADMGVCYPPHRQTVSLRLPAVADTAPETPSSALSELGDNLGLGGGDDEILPPDEAFAFEARALDGGTVAVQWTIAPGHYLYSDKFSFELKGPEGATLGEPRIPAGEEKNDEFFGRIEVFHDAVTIPVPVDKASEGPASIQMEVGYQGCNEVAGICYPPIRKTVSITLPEGSGQTAAAIEMPTVPTAPERGAPAPEPLSEQDSLAQSLATGSTPLVLLTFLGLGLLLAFTPCVFPMIPILSSIIVGQGEGLTTRKAFSLSLVYVLAMAATYTIAGVVAGLFGANIQAAFQEPWILITFSAVFIALALSMFGFYDLQLPSGLQSRLSEFSNRQEGGSLAGVAVMGFLSALIVGPCVAPPLMGALIYIGQTGDPWLGGAALFSLSLGMGAPLLAIGTSAGKLLPRAGAWMDKVKAVFGILLLAVAIWMLERILPAAVTLVLWAVLFIISAVYAGALEPIRETASGWFRLWKGIGVVLLIYGAFLLLAAASGGRDPLQPLAHWRGGGAVAVGAVQPGHLEFETIKTVDGLRAAVAEASRRGQPVMLDFYADWCVSCKEFEKYTFSDAGVQQALSGTRLLQADVTANDEADKALLRHFGLIGPPAIIFYDDAGEERRNHRVVGFMAADEFEAHARRAIGQ